MKTLPINADKKQIRNLVVEWIELLSQEKYQEALDLILYDNTQKIDGTIWVWTPQKLEAAIFTYGEPWYTKEDMKRLYGEDYYVDSKVTSILNSPNKADLLKDIELSISFFDYVITYETAILWGISDLDYKNIIGEIIFDGMPIDGKRSDLTALFWIKKVNENNITLVFRDLHVL